MSIVERLRGRRTRRALWWGLVASLTLTALAAAAAWRLGFEGIGTTVPWILIMGSWGLGYGLAFASDVGRHDYQPAIRALWIVNPVTVWIGGWMFAVVLWGGLAMLLRAAWEDAFGWASVGEDPPMLDV